MRILNAFIRPDGRVIPLGIAQHLSFAQAEGYPDYIELLKLGWVRISSGEFSWFRELTVEQQFAVADLARNSGLEVPPLQEYPYFSAMVEK